MSIHLKAGQAAKGNSDSTMKRRRGGGGGEWRKEGWKEGGVEGKKKENII